MQGALEACNLSAQLIQAVQKPFHGILAYKVSHFQQDRDIRIFKS
jgi:hypothetical protein